MDAAVSVSIASPSLKILVLCYEYPPLGGGGGRVAQSVARKLASRGHQVHVLTGGMPHLAAEEDDHGVKVTRVRSGRRHEDRCSIPEMGAWCMAAFLPARRLIREWQPDVIHAHFAMPTGLLAWGLHRLTRVPYVITTHLGDVPGAFFPRDSALFMSIHPIASRIWSEAAVVTGVSTFVAEAGAEAYHRPVVMIPNAVERIEPRPASESRDVPRLLFVGRLVEQKRPWFLLEALAKLRDLQWELTIVGDGPLMADVKASVEANGLTDRVTVCGWLESASVQAVLRDSDIFCMPSSSEGMPVAAVEALQHGLAIVGSAIPGLRDVLTDGENGRAVEVSDLAGFVRAFRELLTDPARLAAMKSASKLKSKDFDLDHIAVRYEEVLREAAELPPSSCHYDSIPAHNRGT